MIWRCRDFRFDLSLRVLVMGVLNVTPDSFSDGGRWAVPEAALERALAMEAEGADIIDLGGESTRPGAPPVEETEEIRRILPVLERLRPRTRAAISIDTMKAGVARAALEAGADIVNDVSALGAGGDAMAKAVAGSGAGLVLMHMRGTPRTMQNDPRYGDPAGEVLAFLRERIAAAEAAGIARESIAADPGFGFGKTFEHNLELMRRLEVFAALGRPLLVGVSRKAFLRRLAGLEGPANTPEAQAAVLPGGLAAAALAVGRGARIIRTHEVRATRLGVDAALAMS